MCFGFGVCDLVMIYGMYLMLMAMAWHEDLSLMIVFYGLILKEISGSNLPCIQIIHESTMSHNER